MKEVNIGVIVNTHGLRGEVKVKCLSDSQQLRFAKKARVNLHHDGQKQELTIANVREAKGLLIVKFEGYDDINEVEAWKGSYLRVPVECLQKLSEEEAYFYELQNSKVYDMQEHYLGEVVEIIETGGAVVLRVKGEAQEVLIPFVKAFVKAFDKEEKIMHVEVLEGML